MAGEWIETTLGEVIELKRGYDLAATQRKHGRVPIVSSSGVSGRHTEAMVKSPGVVTGRYGTIGQVFYIQEDFWPLNTTLYVRDFKGSNPRFVSYYLTQLDFRAYSDKGAVPGINRNDVHRAIVSWPPRGEQDCIAQMLGSLDDKIELNRRMAATLEEMARTLFKSWFVDFDPVRAKAKGHPTGLPAATAALFPDKFGEDGLPVGWSATADDVGLSVREQVQPSEVDVNTPYVGLEHIEKRSLALSVTGRAEDVDSQKAVFKSGDLLFGKLRPYFHKVAVAPVDGICSTDIFVFRPQKGIPPTYLYLAFSTDDFVTKASGAQGGTRMPRADWGFMRKLVMAKPELQILTAFDNAVAPLIDRLLATVAQTESLAALRNTLLPKLISGELRIKDAKNAVEAA
jgi:type I restriction enzyme, S subunit